MSQDDFDKQKKAPAILFNYTAANASMTLKDYPAAIESYKAVLVLTPDDADHRLPHRPGLYGNDAAAADGCVLVFRQGARRARTRQQANQVKTYLRKLIVNYQQAACDNLIDAELNELLQLAGSSADRPSTYTLPSSADLDAARKDMTIASVITDLKAGGDKAKVTWLAVLRPGISRRAGQADRNHSGGGRAQC